MYSEESLTDGNGSSDVEEPNFMTSFQFFALTEHFQKVLDDIKEDERLKNIRLEFAKLLDTFKSCYAMSDRKTCKIRELLATNTLEVQYARSDPSQQVEDSNGFRRTIHILQNELDAAWEQRRELLKEIEDLRKDVEKADKSTQVVHEENPQVLPDIPAMKDKSIRSDAEYDDSEVSQKSEKESELKSSKETIDIKVLRNDLDILVTNLNIMRKRLAEFKKEVRCRDVLIKEYRKDLSDSDLVLTEMQRKISEIRAPLDMSLKKCKAELVNEKQEHQDVSKRLRAAIGLNAKLSKDIYSKERIIDDLNAQINELYLEKDSTERKANIFEQHLAQIQVNIEALEQENQTLRKKVENLEKEIPTMGDTLDVPEREKMETNAQGRLVENLKNQIATRNRKIRQVVEELHDTASLLQSAKKDFAQMNKEKVSLEFELQDTKKKLKEKNVEIKQLNDKSSEDRKETKEMKKNLYTWIKKYQQVVEERNKFHNLYNLLNRKSSQQENDNVILGRRQQYLVKMLKDKDKEIERLVSWKRYVV